AEALARRQVDPFEPDPVAAVRGPILGAVQRADRSGLAHPERILLAAVVLDATGGGADAAPVARRVVQRLGLGTAAEESVARLVADSGLLSAASRRPEGLDEERVLQLAVHLGSREQGQALYLLTLAANDMDPWERSRLDDLHQFLD